MHRDRATARLDCQPSFIKCFRSFGRFCDAPPGLDFCRYALKNAAEAILKIEDCFIYF